MLRKLLKNVKYYFDSPKVHIFLAFIESWIGMSHSALRCVRHLVFEHKGLNVTKILRGAFLTKVFFEAFMSLQFVFWQNEIGEECWWNRPQATLIHRGLIVNICGSSYTHVGANPANFFPWILSIFWYWASPLYTRYSF